MKHLFIIMMFLLLASSASAQETGSTLDPGLTLCSDGTVADAGCIDLNRHPTIDQTKQLLTLLLSKETKQAQKFCTQDNPQCLSPIIQYFKKVRSYELVSTKLIGADDLTIRSTIEAIVILGDPHEDNQYNFIFEYQRHPENTLWGVSHIDLENVTQSTNNAEDRMLFH
ncbi:hypothetical protein HZU77_010710 [Neisseriaceae bacterium TC5R-5]|nr:hypothetical protein [Neisseriaceae bacterium TC5R-5]